MATFENSPSWCSSAGSSKIAIIIIPVEANQSKLFDDKEEEDKKEEEGDKEEDKEVMVDSSVGNQVRRWQVTLFLFEFLFYKIINNGQIGELDLEAEKEFDVEKRGATIARERPISVAVYQPKKVSNSLTC